jgi:23S rRNA (pseudouridine1915-N3)-methyltransferase
MEITVAAVGRMRSGPLKALWDDYAKRLTWPVSLREVEEKRPLGSAALKKREGELLLKALPRECYRVALDASGRSLDSPAFAKRIVQWMEQSGGHIGFMIGGADGLDSGLVKDASFVLGLGAMTWPHMLARIMLIEQIYRAQCILTNHPYHR